MHLDLNLDDLPKTRRYLIGVSGGRDSVALLHALHSAGYGRLVVCHVNHCLRGRASAQDAAFVQRLAAKLGYPYEATQVQVAERAQAVKQSVETAARDARHEFFAAMARKHRCPRVLLAHHADDQAETVLMRALRGTGIGGLAGMRAETLIKVARTELQLLRPMLQVRRAEIDACIAAHGLRFREDATNADVQAARRNTVRQKLLPQLSEAMGRDVAPMLLRLAQSAACDDDLLRSLSDSLIRDEALVDDEKSLRIKPALKHAHMALQHRVVHHWLRLHQVHDVDRDVIAAVVKLMTHAEPARVNLTRALQVRRKAGRLQIGAQ